MTDPQQEVRQINWTETFGWTHIFKSFNMARHPSKWLLSLAAVLLIFCLGWAMDRIWLVGGATVQPGEIMSYAQQAPWEVDEGRERWKEQRIDDAAQLAVEMRRFQYSLQDYQQLLPSGQLRMSFADVVREMNEGKERPTLNATQIKNEYDEDLGELLGEAEEYFNAGMERVDDALDEAEERAEEAVDKIAEEEDKEAAEELLKEARGAARQAKTRLRVQFARETANLRGTPVFAGLLDYERQCLSNAVIAVRHLNFFGGLRGQLGMLAGRGIPAMSADVTQPSPNVNVPQDSDWRGFFSWVILAGCGICWLICEHWVFATIFLVGVLAITSLFGGAVHRIAALHFAREEKISIPQALKFAKDKFLSYFTAPLIPIAIILVLGVLLMVGGLIGSIPVVGEFIMAILFFVAIVLGLVIAFLLIGLVAGFPLMYPTIAVEGSDSFDAISRSFTYVYSRPWRYVLYVLISLVYGVLTYLFVRLFAWVALKLTHEFVNWGVLGGGNALHPEADKLDVLWQEPTFFNLFGSINWEAMGGIMPVAAWILNMWIFLVAAAVFAYLLSFAASSTTVIYYLLRKKVDATDLDDVYVEELEEDELPSQEQEQPETETKAEGDQVTTETSTEAPQPEPPAAQGPEEKGESSARGGDGEQKSEGEGEGESEGDKPQG